MKHPADFITALRVIFGVGLLFVTAFSPLFFVFYMICGLSDVLDGIIARKTASEHRFGAQFDSFADALFFVIVLIVVLPLIEVKFYVWAIAVGIALIKIVNQLLAFYCYRQMAAVHSKWNKLTGGLLYAFPVLCYFFNDTLIALPICAVALISAVNELCSVLRGEVLLK